MSAGGKKKVWWIAVAAAAVLATILSRAAKDGACIVEAAYPEMGDISTSASAYGRIRPVEEVKISPDVSGEITDIFFDEGDTVKRGDLLLKIKQESYLTAIVRNEASLEGARKALEAQQKEAHLKKLEYERLQRLCESDAGCLAQLEQAEAAFECATARAGECRCQVEAAEAALQASLSELRKTLVYSPMDGVVTSLRIKRGERVVGTATMAGTEMLTIADLDRMETVVSLGENDICNVDIGDRVEIKPDALPGEVLTGHVSKIAYSAAGIVAAGASSDFEVRISIDSRSSKRLLPGMSATVIIHTGSKNNILTVPLQAVFLKDGRETVWKVDDRLQVSSATVSCGIQDFSRTEITGGLSSGDLIVTGPFQAVNKTLTEGARIKLSKDVETH